MANEAYGIYAVKIAGMPDVIIDQITEQHTNPRLQVAMVSGSGSVDPQWVGVNRGEPMAGFTTTAIKKALDACGFGALPITDTNPVTLYYRKRADAGIYAGALSHLAVTVNKGILYPVSLDAAQDADASMPYELLPIFDGTNLPLVIAKNQTVSLTTDVAAMWTVGPAYVNGDAVGLVQRIAVALGLEVRGMRGGGIVWPLHSAIYGRTPSIAVTSPDLSHLDQTAGVGTDGLAISSATRVFLRKKVLGGTTVAENVAEHIMLDVPAGMVTIDEASGSHGDDASAQIVMHPRESGGVLLAIDTARVIDAL